MSFKDILSKLDQLSEGDVKHKGTYGTSYQPDEKRDEYGHRVRGSKEGPDIDPDDDKAPAAKRGRGRPKKGADASGEVKKYDAKALGNVFGGGKLPKKPVGKPSVKHSLKEYFEKVDEMMSQQPIPVVGKQGDTQQTGAGFIHIDDTSPAGQAMSKALGDLARQKKAQIVVPTQGQQSGMQKPTATSGGATNQPAMSEKWEGDAKIKATGEYAGKSTAELKSMLAKLHASGPHKEGSPEAKKQRQINFALRAKGHWKKGEGAAQKEGMAEADLPPQDGLMGAGLGAGRDQGVAETKNLPGNQEKIDVAEPKGKIDAKDFAKLRNKKKVDEAMNTRLKSAHHAGKSHALAKEGYNCRYDDMEEARMYHEGYKEGLDECYGQIPIRGQVVGEEGNTVDDMASFGAHTPALEAEVDEMDRGAYMKQQAIKTPGNTFKAFGQTMHDKDVLETDSMFESWDNQLDSLLEEYQEIQEGLSVSVSKGQQGAPDSVTVSAQDADADKLLQLVKHAGLGLFGDEMQADVGAPVGAHQHGGVDVVGDHDGMMALIKKASGGEPAGTLEPADGQDYKDEEDSEETGELDMIKQLTKAIGGGHEEHGEDGHEEHEHTDEEKCNECGMYESSCECNEETLDEVESEDQQTYEVAEDNPPDTGAQEFQAMDQEIAQDNSAASSHGGAQNSNLEEEDDESKVEESDTSELEEEEELEESYANASDDTFEADIEFMTNIISSGLNKKKSTGQTTIPVIAGQNDRMGYNVNETVDEWKKLAGLR